MRKIQKTILLILLFVLACSPKEDESQVIFQLKDDILSLDDFIFGYKKFLLFTGFKDNLLARNQYLQSEIDKKLLIYYADSTGFSQLESTLFELEKTEKQLLLDRYFEDEIKSNIQLDDADYREAFRRSKIQIHARHLFSKSFEEIHSLHRRLEAGESFFDIAPEIFSDSAMAASGGDLGWFGFNDTEPVFEDVVYSLDDGEYSQPIKTRSGFVIAQVIERNVEPIMTETDYQLHKQDFEIIIRNRKVQAALKNYTDSLGQELFTNISDDEAQGILDNFHLFLKPDATLPDSISQLVLYSGAYELSMPDLQHQLRFTSELQRKAVVDKASVRELITGLFVRMHLLENASKKDWQNDSDFLLELQKRKKQRTIRLLVEQLVLKNHSGSSNTPEAKEAYNLFVEKLNMDLPANVNRTLLNEFVLEH